MNNNTNNSLANYQETIKNGQFEDVEKIVAGIDTEQERPESLIELADIDDKKIPDEIEQQIANLREAQRVFQDEVDKYEQEIQGISRQARNDNRELEIQIELQSKTRIISKNELRDWIEENNLFQSKSGAKVAMLLGGDRLSCCDEVVGIYDRTGKKLVGAASIAPKGEMRSGEPTIVGEFILPEFRGLGYGTELLKQAINRCQERGFPSVRLDVQSGRIMKIIKKLPEETRNYLKVIDQSKFLDTDKWMNDDIKNNK